MAYGRREFSISPVSVVPTSPGKLWSFVFMFVPDAMRMHYHEYYLFQGPNQVPKSCVGFKVGAPQASMLLGEQVPTAFSKTWSTYALGTPMRWEITIRDEPLAISQATTGRTWRQSSQSRQGKGNTASLNFQVVHQLRTPNERWLWTTTIPSE